MAQRGSTPLVAVLVLALAGCSPALSVADADTCNRHAAWVSAGSALGELERLSRDLESMIGESSSEAVATAVRVFVLGANDGDPDVVAQARDELTATCIEAGWTSPEG